MDQRSEFAKAFCLLQLEYQGTGLRIEQDPVERHGLYYWLPGGRIPNEVTLYLQTAKDMVKEFKSNANRVIGSRIRWHQGQRGKQAKQTIERLRVCLKW